MGLVIICKEGRHVLINFVLVGLASGRWFGNG